ncbi:ATPase WRNIP1-like [Harmonia axyridis]|uniref:ATPase WRNIP1-like n=1 Tax=Harmonia axyridis TaxID=115357 RepID=UPI001E276501|nr:ATPase WRNIP1-like [Harmonia axyridis]
MGDKAEQNCPICSKSFPAGEIEAHANKCIFLNSDTPKRKRSVSPSDSTYSHHRHERKKSPALNGDPSNIPLTKQVIPRKIEDFIGQSHVLGDSTILHVLLKKGDIPNMIIWGPPGSGKTSLASIIKHICRSEPEKLIYHSLNAAQCGVKDVQSLVTTASNDSKNGKKTIIFMDEIHKFNKKQQDVFLGPIEQGEITLVGATTENPSFELNMALLSRCRLVVFEKLSSSDVNKILKKAAEVMGIDVFSKGDKNEFQEDRTYIEEAALEWLGDTCNGDARIALNNFELIQKYFSHEGKVITYYDVKEGVKKSHLVHDKKGDEHYNMISALHKSIRGSDPDAALYWTTRMIMGGENPLYIARRLIRAASEDIGEADPQALQLAVSTMQGCQLLGMPEADVLLAQCSVYLAKAPKSRKIDTALGKAKTCIAEQQGSQPTVPLHLRNAPTKLMKDLGYGKPGDYAGFMPESLKEVKFL